MKYVCWFEKFKTLSVTLIAVSALQACKPAVTAEITSSSSTTTTTIVSSEEAGPLYLEAIMPASQFIGGSVILKGTGLTEVAGVLFGDGTVEDYVAVSSKALYVVLPEGVTSGDVLIFDIDGNYSLLENAFTLIESGSSSSSSSSSSSTSSSSSSGASITPEIDGMWETDCIAQSGTSMTLNWKVDNGSTLAAYKVYQDGDTTCSGTYTLYNMDTNAVVTDYVNYGDTIEKVSVTNQPSNLYILKGTDINNDIEYNAAYVSDSNHIYLIMSTGVLSNLGPDWNDWSIGSPIFAGFAANPTTYVAPDPAFNIALHRVRNIYSFSGTWNSQCFDLGGDTYRSIQEVVTDTITKVYVRNFTADASCSGTPTSVNTVSENVSFAYAELAGVPANYSVFTTTDADNGNGTSKAVIYQTSADSFSAYSGDPNQLTGIDWSTWLAQDSNLNTFAGTPLGSNAGTVYHMTREPAPTVDGGSTASIDGLWDSSCMNNSGNGVKLSVKFDNGTKSQAIKFFAGDNTCASSYVLQSTEDNSIVSDYVYMGTFTGVVTVTDAPSGFALWKETQMSSHYEATYRTDATHMQYLLDLDSATYLGPSWSDWTSSLASFFGFDAAPTTYPGDSNRIFNFPLQKVASLYTFDGNWLTECRSFGGGQYGKVYQTFSNNTATADIYMWDTDATCSGPYVSTSNFSNNMAISISSVTGVENGFSAYDSIDHSNGDTVGITIFHQTNPDSFDQITGVPADVNGTTWSDWKASNSTLLTFTQAPTSTSPSFLHFTRVSGPPTQ